MLTGRDLTFKYVVPPISQKAAQEFADFLNAVHGKTSIRIFIIPVGAYFIPAVEERFFRSGS